MSFESQPVENNEVKAESFERRKLRVGNEIQLQLALQNSLPDEGEAGLNQWLEDHAEGFRSIYEEAVKQNPSFLDEWDTHQDRVLEFFQGQLNELEDYQRRAA